MMWQTDFFRIHLWFALVTIMNNFFKRYIFSIDLSFIFIFTALFFFLLVTGFPLPYKFQYSEKYVKIPRNYIFSFGDLKLKANTPTQRGKKTRKKIWLFFQYQNILVQKCGSMARTRGYFFRFLINTIYLKFA